MEREKGGGRGVSQFDIDVKNERDKECVQKRVLEKKQNEGEVDYKKYLNTSESCTNPI